MDALQRRVRARIVREMVNAPWVRFPARRLPATFCSGGARGGRRMHAARKWEAGDADEAAQEDAGPPAAST